MTLERSALRHRINRSFRGLDLAVHLPSSIMSALGLAGRGACRSGRRGGRTLKMIRVGFSDCSGHFKGNYELGMMNYEMLYSSGRKFRTLKYDALFHNSSFLFLNCFHGRS